MVTRWRRAAFSVALAAAVASGWVYPYVRPWPVEMAVPSPQTPDRVRLWHGRVVQVGEQGRAGPNGRQWLVEYPVWNVFQKREYVDRMWFWVRLGTVTDRRTGQHGELTVGQRVSILWHGMVYRTDPGQCHADEVVIESDVLPPVQP